MKGLFAEEIATELSALQEAQTQITPVEDSGAIEDTTVTGPAGTRERAVASERHRRWLGIWAAAALMLAMVLTVVVQQRLTPPPEKNGASPVREDAAPSQQAALPSNRPTPEQPSAALDKGQRAKAAQAMEALKSKRFPQAVALFEEIFSANPAGKAGLAGPYAQALRGHAGMIRESDPVRAEALLKKAAEAEPQSGTSYFELGKFYTARKEYPKAIAAYRKAVDLDPNSPDPRFNLGFLYAQTKDYAAAEAAFLKAISLAPPYLDEVYYNLAMVQKRMGKHQESQKNLERALEANPNNAKAKEQLQRLKARG
jgi:tetratricopeptide (TPR) repeat protein